MTELLSDITQIIGSAPAGCEPIAYMTASALLVILCMSAISMISGIFKFIGGM